MKYPKQDHYYSIKLTNGQAEEIYKLSMSGNYSNAEIAKIYGVSSATIYKVLELKIFENRPEQKKFSPVIFNEKPFEPMTECEIMLSIDPIYNPEDLKNWELEQYNLIK